MKKKFFSALLACALILAVCVGNAFALSISISNSETTLDNTQGYYRTNISAGTRFSITYQASDNQGDVTWSMSIVDHAYDDLDTALSTPLTEVTMSNQTGLSTTVSGVLNSGTSHVDIYMYAFDDTGSPTSLPDEPLLCIENSAVYTNDDAVLPIGPINNNSDGNSDNAVETTSPDVLPEGYIRPIQATELEEGVLEKIAASEDIPVEEIKFITEADIDRTTYEPTDEMRQQASDENLEYAAKLNTVTFTEGGRYLIEIDFPEELVGMNVNDIRLQFVDTDEVRNGDAKTAIFPLLDSAAAAGELRTMFGDIADTIPGKALLLLMSNSGGSFTAFALKMILALLGGCNAGVAPSIGWGIAGLLCLSGGLVFRKFFRKRKN